MRQGRGWFRPGTEARALGDCLAIRDNTLTIVTGASSNHVGCLRNLLRSIDHHETAPVVVYDLGLAPEEAAQLRAEGRQVVRFPFERYPPYFGTRAKTGQPCSWKPVLIREVIEAVDSPVMWLDAGDLVHERLTRVRSELAITGFYSPEGSDVIERYTHPQVLALLEAQPEILADCNRNGAIVGFGRNQIGMELSRIWRDCALREEIMYPAGWTKRIWRSDQAILSVLVAQFRRRHGFVLADELLGVSYHNDSLTAAQAQRYMTSPPVRGGARALRERDDRRIANRLRRVANRLRRVANRLWPIADRLRRRAKRTWRRLKKALARR